MSDDLPAVLPVSALAPDDGKEPCPDCGLRFVPGPGMGVHRHSAHGRSSKKRKHTRAASNGGPGPGRPPRVDLDVDDIFDTVIKLMFPRGTIPVDALTPLLRWRHATDEMLIEVLHHGDRK